MVDSSRHEGSFRELAAGLLADAYPDTDSDALQQEASAASAEISKLDELSEEMDRAGGFAASSVSGASRDEDLERYLPAAIAGDKRAIEHILRSIRPLVVRYCRARLGRSERTFASADDVAQEVCMAVLTSLSSYRDQGRPFLAFVYGIAAHKVIDAHRAAGRNKSEPVRDVPSDSASGLIEKGRRVNLVDDWNAIIDDLPEESRRILELRILKGLSAEETAEILGTTPGRVRVAQHRALSRLRQKQRLRD